MTDSDINNVPSHRQWFSSGYVCQLLQIVPGQLTVLMDDIEMAFDQMLDGVGMLRGDQVLALSKRCREVRAEIESAAGQIEAAESN